MISVLKRRKSLAEVSERVGGWLRNVSLWRGHFRSDRKADRDPMFNELIKIVRQGDPKVLELEGMGVLMPLMKIRNSLTETRGDYKFNY